MVVGGFDCVAFDDEVLGFAVAPYQVDCCAALFVVGGESYRSCREERV